MLTEGMTAPDFSLPADGGGTVSLADYRGKKVVLYFYPKDNTPGCTTEACNFRDDYSEIAAAGAAVIGISPDTVQSHDRFKLKHSLPFVLLSDPDHLVAEAYGVWREKKMFGRDYMGIIRSTFIINPDGKVAKIFSKVRVKGHSRQVLAALTE